MSVKYEFTDTDGDKIALDEQGTINTSNSGTSGVWVELTPEAAISLASKLLQYGTQAYRYPKKSDADNS